MKLHPWLLKQLKKKARIYILPTKMGGYFNGLIFLLFLLALGYSNNLVLIFTLFLFGLNITWVIQSHFHLHALKLQSLIVQDNFAKEKGLVEVFWKKSPPGLCHWSLSLEETTQSFSIETVSDSEVQSVGQVQFPKRGVWHFSHLKVKSQMPFGLYQVWIYLPIAVDVFVYPEKLKEVLPLGFNTALEEGDSPGQRAGSHDIWNLGPYQGEEARKINWKHYARSGELVVNEGEDQTKSEVHFKLFSFDESKEYALSKMATQMVHCARSETDFFLETTHQKRISGLTACLRELARC